MTSENYHLPYCSLKPNQATIFYQSTNPGPRNYNENTKVVQPKNNKPKRNLSFKGRRRVQNSINWLLYYAKDKRIYNEKRGKYFNFKINFITLTLPTLQFHADNTIKSKALNSFLTYLRKHFDLNNYIWRAECQANGNIHFHIATDTYIPYFIIRSTWNRQLRKLGYIDKYSSKFNGMSRKEYVKYSIQQGQKDLSIILKRYDYGVKTNWKDPNTTDIHSVNKVRNLAAYLSKYMTKGEAQKDENGDYELKFRRIEGKLWGRSESLSRCKGIVDLVGNKMSIALEWIDKYLATYRKKEDWFYYISFNSSKLQGWIKNYFKKLYEDYRKLIDYEPGGIPDKVYKYSGV